MNINIFGRTTKRRIKGGESTEETLYGYNGKPRTNLGRICLEKAIDNVGGKFVKLSDSYLLDIMWGKMSGGLGWVNINLKQLLERHYRSRSGRELPLILSNYYWQSSADNNRRALLERIRSKVQHSLDNDRWLSSFGYNFDCSSILDSANIDFRKDIHNSDLTIPMGGVQEVRMSTVDVSEDTSLSGMLFSNSKYRGYNITLKITLRDNFGVDEDDFSALDIKRPAKSIVTALGRDALTAFWILQHQRGYPPFIWDASFKSQIKVYKKVKK